MVPDTKEGHTGKPLFCLSVSRFYHPPPKKKASPLMLICSCCVIHSGATSGLICPISSDECKQTLVEWFFFFFFFFFLHMKNFHEQSGEKWVCLCMCDVDSVDCRPQLLPFITTCQNGRHFLPPHTQKANQCCFFFINATCLRERNDGKCHKQDNKCIYSVYARGWVMI